MVSEVAVYWLRLVCETSGWCLVLTRGVWRVRLICIDSFGCAGCWMFANGKRGSSQLRLYLFLLFWLPLGVFKRNARRPVSGGG